METDTINSSLVYIGYDVVESQNDGTIHQVA